MFKIKNTLVKQLGKVNADTISSIVDQNMTITGELRFKGKTRIDGTVNGNIYGDHLILSRPGRIRGDILVASFIRHGTMGGNVTADLVSARKNCFIHGKVAATDLVVEPGAVLDGEVRTAAETGSEAFDAAAVVSGRGQFSSVKS